jgi:hypothetical protein
MSCLRARCTHVSPTPDTPPRMSVPADSAVVILGPVPNAADSGVRGKASGWRGWRARDVDKAPGAGAVRAPLAPLRLPARQHVATASRAAPARPTAEVSHTSRPPPPRCTLARSRIPTPWPQVVFKQAKSGDDQTVHVSLKISGLKPGKHGFHVHALGA